MLYLMIVYSPGPEPWVLAIWSSELFLVQIKGNPRYLYLGRFLVLQEEPFIHLFC